jgi:hypothetical protein
VTIAPLSAAEKSARAELPVEYFAGRKLTGDFAGLRERSPAAERLIRSLRAARAPDATPAHFRIEASCWPLRSPAPPFAQTRRTDPDALLPR